MKDFLFGYQIFFSSLFRYREYLKQSVARDLRRRYKRSVLGYLWSMLNPLFMMIILTIVFSEIMRIQVEHYSVFLFVALLPWQYFSQTIEGSLDSVRGNINIIDHVPIPKYIFALSVAFSSLANFLLALIPLLLLMVVMGRPITFNILLFPLIFIPLFTLSCGVALVCSAANVFFDDTRHLVNVLLQAMYFLTPILYGREHLPPRLVAWLWYNPMFHIVEMMRRVFYYGEGVGLEVYLVSLLVGFVVLGIGLWIFRKADAKFLYFV